jgi:hypothetical protein
VPRDKLRDILEDAAKTFSVPHELLEALVLEERLRLYQLRKRFIIEDIDAIFEKYAGR